MHVFLQCLQHWPKKPNHIMATTRACEHVAKCCSHQTEHTAMARILGRKRDRKVMTNRGATTFEVWIIIFQSIQIRTMLGIRYTQRREIQATLPLPAQRKAHLLRFHRQQTCNTWGEVHTGPSPAVAPSLRKPLHPVLHICYSLPMYLPLIHAGY